MRLRLHTALAVSCCISACSVDDDPAPATRLEVVQAPATVVPGEPTPQVVIVRVLDGMGQSTQGAPVRWGAALGSGSISAIADTSGIDGLASAEWLPGAGQGEQVISVYIYDQPALQIRVRADAFRADKIGVYYRDGCGLSGTAVWCWKHASFYGPGATITRVLPQLHLTDLAVTSGYICALDDAGTTYCHATFDASSPESFVTPAGLPPIRAISGGGTTFCGIALADGSTWCWKQQTLAPAQVPGGLQFSSVSAGAGNSCGLTSAGAAWCWASPAGSPVAVPGGHVFRTISASQISTCGIEAPTTLYCWSGNNAPVALPGIPAMQVAIGTFNEGVVNTSGSAMVFSLDTFDANTFTLESGALSTPVISAADHCALTFDRAVYCALPDNGSNSFGPFRWVGIPAPAE